MARSSSYLFLSDPLSSELKSDTGPLQTNQNRLGAQIVRRTRRSDEWSVKAWDEVAGDCLSGPPARRARLGGRPSDAVGTCPVYTLIIRSDGTFRYVGEQYVSRLGRHTWRIERKEFDRLARFAWEVGFTQFTSYSAVVTDESTVYTMIDVDGRLKIVSDYGRAGPPKLLEFEAMIDKALQDAQWD